MLGLFNLIDQAAPPIAKTTNFVGNISSETQSYQCFVGYDTAAQVHKCNFSKLKYEGADFTFAGNVDDEVGDTQ